MKTILPFTIALLSWNATQAASLSTTALGYVRYDPTDGGMETYSFYCDNHGTTSAACVNPTGEVSSTAEASYSSVRVNVTTADPLGIPGDYGPGVSVGYGTASADDLLTILGGVGTGTLRYLYQFYYSSDRSAGASGSVGSGSSNCSPDPVLLDLFCETPVTFGVPVELHLQAEANGHTPDYGPGDTSANSSAFIGRFTIRDAEGRALPAYYISAESGTKYETIQAVPEPSTALLIFAAGLGLAIIHRVSRVAPPAGSSARTLTRD